jgi:2-oxoglutarate ferredoxin oxidoreductase subunit alpha
MMKEKIKKMTEEKNRVQFLSGNEACVWAGIHAKARFFAGYPISPATEIAEICAQELPKHGGFYIQMEDEIGSIAAVIGASLGGLRAFTATSGPGLALMQENIGYAAMAEVPCVIINVQRFGPSTGIATKPAQSDVMTTRWGTPGDHSLIVLAPSGGQECYDLTFAAFGLAELFRTPVIVLIDAVIAHLREKVTVKTEEKFFLINGDKRVLRVTGLVHDSFGYSSDEPEVTEKLITRLAQKIEGHQMLLPRPRFYGSERPEVLIISFGISARAARQAVYLAEQEDLAVSLLELKTLWPFPEEEIRKIGAKAKTVLVAELNRGQVQREVRACGISPEKVRGINKIDTTVITPSEILNEILTVIKND